MSSTIPTETMPQDAAPEPASSIMLQQVQLILPDPADPVAVAMAQRGILTCQQGQVVARRVETPADTPRHKHRVLLAELRFGPGAAWDAKQEAYVATVPGQVSLEQGKLQVADKLELYEDIDALNGDVIFAGNLIAHRNVLDLTVLKATGNITVNGSVEAAEIHAGGDLHVLHGICGKERGHVSATGRLSTRFLTNAHATSGGDMVIANEIVTSHLTCGGILKVEHGTILAGHAVALGGIQCHTAGSDAGAKTILEIGLPRQRYAAIAETLNTAELARQKARTIRDTVGPLMARAKSLTATQKEKATELLFAADEAEAQASEVISTLAQLKASLQQAMSARISVGNKLHPGVLLRFPVVEALVNTPIRGPVEIVLSDQGGETHIAIIDRCRNTYTPLPSLASSDGTVDIARRLLAER